MRCCEKKNAAIRRGAQPVKRFSSVAFGVFCPLALGVWLARRSPPPRLGRGSHPPPPERLVSLNAASVFGVLVLGFMDSLVSRRYYSNLVPSYRTIESGPEVLSYVFAPVNSPL